MNCFFLACIHRISPLLGVFKKLKVAPVRTSVFHHRSIALHCRSHCFQLETTTRNQLAILIWHADTLIAAQSWLGASVFMGRSSDTSASVMLFQTDDRVRTVNDNAWRPEQMMMTFDALVLPYEIKQPSILGSEISMF